MTDLSWSGLLVGVFVGLFIFFCLHKGLALVVPNEDGKNPTRLQKVVGFGMILGQLLISGGALYVARRASVGDLSLGLGLIGGLLLLTFVIWVRGEKKDN